VLDHLSPSSIQMFQRCGEQFRRRYIEGEIVPPGIAMIIGGSVHKAAETNHRQKLTSRVDLPGQDLRDVAETEFNARLKDGWRKEQEDDDPGKAKDKAMIMTNIYRDSIAPTIQPVLVEQEAAIDLPGSDVRIVGILDVADDQKCIRDLKTAGRKKQQAEADTSVALTLYTVQYRMLTGEWPSGLALDCAIVTESGKPDYQQLVTTRSELEINAALAKAWNMLEAVRKGVFIPRTRADGNYLCTRRFCGYAPTCRYCDSKE